MDVIVVWVQMVGVVTIQQDTQSLCGVKVIGIMLCSSLGDQRTTYMEHGHRMLKRPPAAVIASILVLIFYGHFGHYERL